MPPADTWLHKTRTTLATCILITVLMCNSQFGPQSVSCYRRNRGLAHNNDTRARQRKETDDKEGEGRMMKGVESGNDEDALVEPVSSDVDNKKDDTARSCCCCCYSYCCYYYNSWATLVFLWLVRYRRLTGISTSFTLRKTTSSSVSAGMILMKRMMMMIAFIVNIFTILLSSLSLCFFRDNFLLFFFRFSSSLPFIPAVKSSVFCLFVCLFVFAVSVSFFFLLFIL